MTEQSVAAAPLLDEITCRRIGTLIAYGFSDLQVCDALLVTQPQLDWAREQEEYKKSFAQYAKERLQRQMDVSDGWDAVEEKAIEHVLQTLEYNRDPAYALAAAKIANQAKRHAASTSNGRVLDTRDKGKVIVLQMNKTYIDNRSGDGGLNVATRDPGRALVRKQSDVPSPKTVSQLLSPKKNTINDNPFAEDYFLNDLNMTGEGQ